MLQTAINICVSLVKQHSKINEYAVAYVVYHYFILDYLIQHFITFFNQNTIVYYLSITYNPGHSFLELYNIQYNSKSPQVKRNLIFSIRVALQVDERRQTKTYTKLENIGKILSLGSDTAQCQISLPEIKQQQQQSKTRKIRYQTFFCPTHFCCIFIPCSSFFCP